MGLLTGGAKTTALGGGGYSAAPTATATSTAAKADKGYGIIGGAANQFDITGASGISFAPGIKKVAAAQSAAAPLPKARSPLEGYGRKKGVYARPGE